MRSMIGSYAPPTVDKRPYGDMVKALAIGVGGSIVATLGYGLQARSLGEYVAIATSGLLVSLAALATGAFAGFLFGVPLAPREVTAPAERKPDEGNRSEQADITIVPVIPYRANTNLEQISDWLTKILVGVGLTQLGNLAGSLRGLGNFLAPLLGGFPSSAAFAIGILICSGVSGFLMSFLWTRVNLATLLTEADVQAALAVERKKGEKIGENRAAETLAAVEPLAKQIKGGKIILWVDDRPANNSSEAKMLKERLEVQIDTSLSTDDALARIDRDPERYSVIISDMGRPGDSQAGYTLLQQLREKKIQTPYIIYSAMSSPAFDETARQRGATGVTNSPFTLLQLVTIALKGDVEVGPPLRT